MQQSFIGRFVPSEKLFALITALSGLVVVAVVGAIGWVLVEGAALALHTFGCSFVTSEIWDPEPSRQQFGALAFLYGTIVTSGIALCIAVPLGVAVAIFLSELCPERSRRVCVFFIEMLAAIPSVVYGFWGLVVFAPWFQTVMTLWGAPNQGGVGLLTAGVVLSIMVLPYITTVSYDSLRAVSRGQREGCLALGATRWQMICDVLLPNARPGITGGCFLALGRALGETMAVTMLIGNRPEISASLFGPGNSIASALANEFAEASYDLHLSALFALSLLLLAMSVLINWSARVLNYRSQCSISRLPRASRDDDAGAVRERQKLKPTSFFTVRDTAAAQRLNHLKNRFASAILGGCFVVTVTPLFLILGYLIAKGMGGLSLAFFTELPAPVGEAGGGIGNAIVGSLLLLGLATVMAVPVGILAAIFVVEYQSTRLARVVRFVGELLGGIPSIVVGIFVYAVVVKPMRHFSGWAGAVALAVMMLPVLMRAGEEAFRLVPKTLKEASYALGANRLQTTVRVTLPAVLPALVTTVFLAISRVAGETAPLLLTASSSRFWPSSPSDFMPSLPVYIFNYSISPYEEWHNQAWAAALVLLSGVMLLNFGIRSLIRGGLREFRISAE